MAAKRPRTIATHPGEILRTEFMEPLGITAYQLAKAIHCLERFHSCCIP
jgi:plasmid maintenance system antidote protein VapI